MFRGGSRVTRPGLLRALVVLYALCLAVALYSVVPHKNLFKKKPADAVKSGSLAIVNVYGPIRVSMTPSSAWSPPDADAIARRLHRLSENDDVKAILLRINSPGGTVGAVQEIYRELQRCRQKGKIIVASFGDVAASGGYYLGAAADHIVADPGSITGSIGVIMQVGNLEGLFQKVGVRFEVIKTGAHKDIGSVSRPMTPEERRMLQASMDDAYAQFLDAVATGRKMRPEQLSGLADGRIFTGREAQRAGLVDELGNRQDAIQAAIRLAKLPEKPDILSDSSSSMSGLLRQLSTGLGLEPMEGLADLWHSPSMEYRWR